MGHTLYYRTRVERWQDFCSFMGRVCAGLGYSIEIDGDDITIYPPCQQVEPLRIGRNEERFVKTNLIEPCHSVYLLILHSVAFFGSLELWEDSIR